MEDIALGNVTGWRRTLRFTLPSIVMMVFISSYTMVDGVFVSNFIDTDALAAINILMPVGAVLTGTGFMFATGGSAYVSNLLGRGEVDRARSSFTLLFIVLMGVTVVFSIIGFVFIEDFSRLLGANDSIIHYCVEYGRAYILFSPFFALQFLCTQFLIVCGRPGLSLVLSVVAGVTNIVLDYVFIVGFDWGISGAALASAAGSIVPTAIGVALFIGRSMLIRFVTPSRDMEVITSSCSNGVSEMVTELSGGVTTLVYNLMMMHYLGPDGVTAITIMMYVQFLAIAIIIGYSNGIAPVMSYNHGAEDRPSMHRLFRISTTFVIIVSVAVFIFMELFSHQTVALFAGGNQDVMDIAVRGAMLFSPAFIFMGLNIYASSLFTSLSNGLVSAVISFLRSLALLVPLVVLIPTLTGDIGWIWLAVPLTEAVTFAVSSILLRHYGPRYGFLEHHVRHDTS